MNRERLGRLVYERRRALGLSIARAARDAGINRATWTAIEDASRDTETYNYGPVERVLGWASGSIDDILDGGEPTLQIPTSVAEPEMARPAETPTPQVEDEAIVKVMQSDKVPESEKPRIIAILIADREREQQRRLALAEDLMRDYNDEAS